MITIGHECTFLIVKDYWFLVGHKTLYLKFLLALILKYKCPLEFLIFQKLFIWKKKNFECEVNLGNRGRGLNIQNMF